MGSTAFPTPSKPVGRIPVVLAIDIEPDGKPAGREDPVRVEGLAATISWLDGLRPRLEAATGRPARFAWFLRMDPQIQTLTGRATGLAERAPEDLARLRGAGDGIGLHTHAGRWDAATCRWIVDHGDPSWMEHCVRTSFDAYETAFGEPSRQHRFGDRWSSPESLDLVAELGARVDLSPEPGSRPVRRLDRAAEATGMIPSYLHLRSIPQPHRESGLWILPMTSADPGPALSPLRRAARRVRFAGQPRHRPLLLDRGWRSAGAYWSIMERALGELPVPYIAFAIRSDLSLRPEFRGVRALLDALLSRDLVRRLEFMDAVEAIGLLRSAPPLASPAGQASGGEAGARDPLPAARTQATMARVRPPRFTRPSPARGTVTRSRLGWMTVTGASPQPRSASGPSRPPAGD